MVNSSEAQRNTRQPWSTPDQEFALENRGLLSPTQIAEQIGVTRKAVYHFFQSRHLSPLNTPDGLITIAEYARSLGLTPASVYERIERGELEVLTLEGSLRKWIDPKQLIGQSGRWIADNTTKAEVRQLEGKSCLNCGSFFLERGTNNTCGSLCRSEQSAAKRFREKKGILDPSLSLPPHLRLGFQDQIVEEGLLIRWPWISDRYSFPIRKNRALVNLDQQIKWVLATHRGRVVTTSYIGAVLASDAQKYNLRVDPLTNTVPIEGDQVRYVINSLERPEEIEDCGFDEWAVATHRILSRDQQLALRFLLQHRGRFVKQSYLEADIVRFGGSFNPGRKYKLIDALKKHLEKTHWRVEEQKRNINSTYYRIIIT